MSGGDNAQGDRPWKFNAAASFAPGEKHWHGASEKTAMSHVAVQEKLDGKAVEWMEHVSDDQYRR